MKKEKKKYIYTGRYIGERVENVRKNDGDIFCKTVLSRTEKKERERERKIFEGVENVRKYVSSTESSTF